MSLRVREREREGRWILQREARTPRWLHPSANSRFDFVVFVHILGFECVFVCVFSGVYAYELMLNW